MAAAETRCRASERYRDARNLGARLDPSTPATATSTAERDAATVDDVLAATANLASALKLAAKGAALALAGLLAER